jgi:uncharacterized protein
MKDILHYLVSQIVTYPEDILIDERTENDRTTLTISVNKEDIGKIIGKQGRVIRSLRDLIKLVAAKNNAYVDVLIAE